MKCHDIYYTRAWRVNTSPELCSYRKGPTPILHQTMFRFATGEPPNTIYHGKQCRERRTQQRILPRDNNNHYNGSYPRPW